MGAEGNQGKGGFRKWLANRRERIDTKTFNKVNAGVKNLNWPSNGDLSVARNHVIYNDAMRQNWLGIKNVVRTIRLKRVRRVEAAQKNKLQIN